MFNEDSVKKAMNVPIGTGSTQLTGKHNGGLNERFSNISFSDWITGNTPKQKAKNEERLAGAEFDKSMAALLQQMAQDNQGGKAQTSNNTAAFVVGGLVVAAVFVTVAIVLYKKKKAEVA